MIINLMDSDIILGFFLFFFIFGLIVFIFGIYGFKKKSLIENTPTSKIRSIAMGLVEIYGEVVPFNNNFLKSPFSNTDCVYYRYTVEELRSSGKSSSWVTIKSGKHWCYFNLKDETGMVLVCPEGAKISIPIDYEFNSSLGRDPPPIVINFLRSQKISHEGLLFGINKTMRYREYFIAVGDKLYIMGTAGDNPLREDASAEIGVEDVMIQKGKYEKFYYISDKTEKEILSRLNMQVFGGIILGAFLMALGLSIYIF